MGRKRKQTSPTYSPYRRTEPKSTRKDAIQGNQLARKQLHHARWHEQQSWRQLSLQQPKRILLLLQRQRIDVLQQWKRGLKLYASFRKEVSEGSQVLNRF